MKYSALLGTGSYLPKRALSNVELSKQVDTSHEWIVERTGIESRHIADNDETTTFMAIAATKAALSAAALSASEIDLIIVATCTADSVFPPTACLVQEALGIPPCPAFDIQVACSGFIYGVTLVDQFIRSGAAKKALLIGSETMSRVVDWQDRRTCVLFGDGAGAAIFGASETPGILGTHLAADGRDKEVLTLKNAFQETIDMQGSALFKLAVNKLDKIAAKMLADHQLSVADLDWLVPHQANIRILKATADKLGLPMEKVILTLQNQGNTSAASIPLALDIGIKEQKIQPGALLLLEAFGAGLTWGTALIRY